jgi:hypothetical protein
MRSALDLTLFVLAGDRSKKPRKIQFPFPKDANGIEDAIKKGQVEFAGKKVVEAVRLLKPYPTGNPILSGIHALDIRDKHRLLILSRCFPRAIMGSEAGNYIGMLLGIHKLPFTIPGCPFPGASLLEGPNPSAAHHCSGARHLNYAITQFSAAEKQH